jgi:hypothetical protein
MTMILSPKQLAVFRDLGEKYPVGPSRLLKRRHYKIVRDWSNHYNREVPLSVVLETVPAHVCDPSRATFFGYDPIELMALGINETSSSRRAARSCAKEGESYAASHRRAKLALSRIEVAINHVRKVGAPGIWIVSSHYAGMGSLWSYARIWGETKEAVEAQARLIGPMTGLDPNWPLNIKFERLGTREDAMKDTIHQITRGVNSLKNDLHAYKERVRTTELKLAAETEKLSALMGGVMLLSGSEEDSEKEAAL